MTQTADLLREIAAYRGRPLTLMEVCGTHTAAISELGLPSLLPDGVRLISGPGCPVCVTVSGYIDRLIGLATTPGTCVVSFGDLLRVKGSAGDLRSAPGACVEMVYTPFRAIELAKENPHIRYVFAAVGFETTAPIYALMAEQVLSEGIDNLRLLTALKTMPAVIRTLCRDQDHAIDGFIAPGHVATLIGADVFAQLAAETGKPFAVAGFSAPSLPAAILSLIRDAEAGRAICRNFYPSAVTTEGNSSAAALVDRYFAPAPAVWRGLGRIPYSGLLLRPEFARLDAGSADLIEDHIPAGCRCADVIAGKISPTACPWFGQGCRPESPHGACMVSMEGACYQYYWNARQ